MDSVSIADIDQKIDRAITNWELSPNLGLLEATNDNDLYWIFICGADLWPWRERQPIL